MKLSKLLERLEEDAERDAMLAQTVKNPDTNQDITVKTALGYDKNHPARKAAAKIYAQFMAKKSVGQPAANQNITTPSAAQTALSNRPPVPRRFGKMAQRRTPDRFGSDDGFDAMRDRGAERGTWKRGRRDPFYDPQDYK